MADVEDLEQLSAAELAELGRDRLADGDVDDDGSVLILAFAEPASLATPLGTATIAQAEKFLKIPLREDAGVNQDSQGYIRTFFVEGLKWSADTWDHWIDKFPKSVVIKPEWCAAFGSYCARKAYEAAGLKLPARPSASASTMADRFTAAGRFLRREQLFADDGTIRAEVEAVPGPGDLVVFKGHVGMVREMYLDGTFVTIEGNTYKGSPRRDGVYQCNRSSTEKRADGTFKIVGFCLLASRDGAKKKESGSEAPPPPAAGDSPSAGDEEPPPAGEEDPSPGGEPAPAS